VHPPADNEAAAPPSAPAAQQAPSPQLELGIDAPGDTPPASDRASGPA
jgi:hypothetical protein